METCRIRVEAGTGSGGRAGWVKNVTAVDTTKTNGFAFVGEFLKPGVLVDLPSGSVLVCCDPTGSAKHGGKLGEVRVVVKSSEYFLESTTLVFKIDDWFADFLKLRDSVVRLLAIPPDERWPGLGHKVPVNPLADFSDEQIADEFRRRFPGRGALV